MRPKLTLVACAILALVLIKFLSAQQQEHAQQPEHDMSSMDGMNMQHDGAAGEQEMNVATQMMSSHHMDGGPHMKMTELRSLHDGDQQRADLVVDEARKVMAKYQDYHTALDDGFQIFLPNVPQKQYHFTNYRYGFEASFHFNPDHPTSLLYDKTAKGYQLAGVMYTAPARFNEDELNERIPLSVAQWHEHVNFCFPPKDHSSEMRQKNPKFGMAGSISTKDACDAVGGKFVPRVFGWMVHVYPDDKNVWGMGPGMHHD